MKFKQNLRRLRESKNLTKAELAAKIGWSDSKYSRIEDIGLNGSQVSIDDAHSLAEFFKIPPTFMFDENYAASYADSFLLTYEFIEGYVQGKWTLNEVRHSVTTLHAVLNTGAHERYIQSVKFLKMIKIRSLEGFNRLNNVLAREEEYDLTHRKSKILEPLPDSIDP